MVATRAMLVGSRPVILSFPTWLYSDHTIGALLDRLAQVAGPDVVVFRNPVSCIAVAAYDALEGEIGAVWARLADEITVWRLATDDGLDPLRGVPGGLSSSAHVAHSLARQRAEGTRRDGGGAVDPKPGAWRPSTVSLAEADGLTVLAKDRRSA